MIVPSCQAVVKNISTLSYGTVQERNYSRSFLVASLRSSSLFCRPCKRVSSLYPSRYLRDILKLSNIKTIGLMQEQEELFLYSLKTLRIGLVIGLSKDSPKQIIVSVLWGSCKNKEFMMSGGGEDRKSDGLISEELAKRMSIVEEGNVSVGVAGTATVIDEPPTPSKEFEKGFFGSSGKNKCAFEDVCSFLSAVMRKSYPEALNLANEILTVEPTNTVVQEFIPVLHEIIAEDEKQSGDLMSTSDSDSSARSESEEEEDEEEFEEDIGGQSSPSASMSSDSEEEGSTESSQSGSSAESISSGSETSDISLEEEMDSFDSTLSMLHEDKDEEDEAPAEDSDDDGYEV